MEKKNLKKLKLKKQTVVDLSDNESLKVKGGTTAPCTYIVSAIVTALTEGDYSHTGWHCGGCSLIGGDTYNCTACDCDPLPDQTVLPEECYA